MLVQWPMVFIDPSPTRVMAFAATATCVLYAGYAFFDDKRQ